MSGNTIGGIIGGAIGFAIGGPAGAQWGWMIGSVVGGIVDPQVIQGAKWQNQQLQGSSDGLARAVVFGTAIVTGNLLDAEPNGPRIGKKKEGGKGGPEVERDTAILTYAIEICDSSELRGTKVNGIIAVWEDEKLVYDVRPDRDVEEVDDNLFIYAWKLIHSKKWDRNKKFYFGGEDQMPPPELEAIHGVGNVPAYRGSCIMVVHDEDLMVDIDDKPRGRIPTYRFLVSVCEPVMPETPAFLGTGQSEGIARPVVNLASAQGTWLREENTQIIPLATTGISNAVRFADKVYLFVNDGYFYTSDYDDLLTWTLGGSVPYTSLLSVSASGNTCWIVARFDGLLRLDRGATSPTLIPTSVFSGWLTAVCAFGTTVAVLTYAQNVYVSDDNGETFEFRANLFGINRFFTFDIATDGLRHVVCGRDDYGTYAAYSEDGCVTWHACDVPAGIGGTGMRVKWVGGRNWLIGTSSATKQILYSTDDGKTFDGVTLPFGTEVASIAVDAKSLRVAISATDSLGNCYLYHSDNLFTWTMFEGPSNPISSLRLWDLNPLISGVVPIPDAPGYLVGPDGQIIGPDVPVGTMCSAPLDHVVRTLHKLGAPQLTDAEFALSPLEGQYVRGYTVQDANVTVADACTPLCKVWNFDLPAYDGKVRALMRGRAVDWTLNPDDLVAMDSGYDEGLQDESLAFPRKLHFSYTDPNIDYKETTQVSERYSADARVAGEEQISMKQLMMTATEAKRAVVKAHKLSWANIEDTRKLAAPIEYIHAVNSDTFNYAGKRYRLDQMRVEGLQVVFESAAYDRVSSYQSLAIGVEGTPPPDSEGFVRGPTVSAFMNMPVLRDEDDKAGIYWAASGLLSGWKGAALQLSRDGVTFTDTGVSVSAAATIGTLLESVGSASRYVLDDVNAIKLKLNPLAGSLESTDMAGLLREANAAALVYPDGTVEVIQFMTATETDEREYTLTGLLRGRMNTAVGVHTAGATFVLLNDAVRFVPLRNEDSGTTLTMRAVSNGTVAETNLTTTVPLGVLQSLKEWEPVVVRATTGTDIVDVTWAGRGRLGSSRMPVPSLNFKEYRVTVTKGGASYTVFTTAQAATVPAPGITEPYTTTVAAISRIASQFDSSEGA